MKLGIMGLGNIGQKAFLPIYITMNNKVDWVIYSRDASKGKHLQDQYNFKNIETDFESFLNSGIEAVMIHTPTHTHYDSILPFLKKGIHVYVDKPLSEDLQEMDRLYACAKENECILFVGFNRRFAPMYQKLKQLNDKTMIIVQKNRANTMQHPKFALFDMMSHVVDTALYLSDEPITSHTIQTHVDEDVLCHVTLTMQTKNTTVIAIMNMVSGAHTERVDVMCQAGHYSVDNMDSLTIQTPQSKTVESFGDWTPTLDKRGFTSMIASFINTIKTNTNTDADEVSVRLTHEMLEKIYQDSIKS